MVHNYVRWSFAFIAIISNKIDWLVLINKETIRIHFHSGFVGYFAEFSHNTMTYECRLDL